jgi:hypothetical protein
VFYCYFFNSDILLEDHFYFTILVQGYDDQWEKAPEIPQFIDLFSPRHKLLLDKYKSAGLDFLPQRITINNFIKKQAIACKKYPFVVNLDEFESVAEQITKPMFEVEFLIKPIEDTLDEFITRYRK